MAKYLTIKQVLKQFPDIPQQTLQAQMAIGDIRVKVRRKDVKKLMKTMTAFDQKIEDKLNRVKD